MKLPHFCFLGFLVNSSALPHEYENILTDEVPSYPEKNRERNRSDAKVNSTKNKQEECLLILSNARDLQKRNDQDKYHPTIPSAQNNGEFEHADFWEENALILRKAWSCYYDQHYGSDHVEDITFQKLIHASLYETVEAMHIEPTSLNEHRVQRLWHDVLEFHKPKQNDERNENFGTKLSKKMVKVFVGDFLSLDGVRWLRSQLDFVDKSGIPTRRPNGMNRRGYIIDDRMSYQKEVTRNATYNSGKEYDVCEYSDQQSLFPCLEFGEGEFAQSEEDIVNIPGSVSIPSFSLFVRKLVERYVRPIGRMLYPEYVGIDDDIEMFAFTIRYDGEKCDPNVAGRFCSKDNNSASEDLNQFKTVKDVSLSQHRDASVITININLNLPEESYLGSSLYFVNDEGGENYSQSDEFRAHVNVTFESGTALIHRGSTPHGAYPIEHGTRHNLIIWLFGKDGVVRASPYHEWEQITLEQRWGK